jgi:hypothetical protein
MSVPNEQNEKRQVGPLFCILSAVAIVLGLILGAIAGINFVLYFRLIDIC